MTCSYFNWKNSQYCEVISNKERITKNLLIMRTATCNFFKFFLKPTQLNYLLSQKFPYNERKNSIWKWCLLKFQIKFKFKIKLPCLMIKWNRKRKSNFQQKIKIFVPLLVWMECISRGNTGFIKNYLDFKKKTGWKKKHTFGSQENILILEKIASKCLTKLSNTAVKTFSES